MTNKEKLLTAREARQLSERAVYLSIDDVLSRIRKAAKSGKTKVYLFHPIMPNVREELISLGYWVHQQIPNDNTYYTIQW